MKIFLPRRRRDAEKRLKRIRDNDVYCIPISEIWMRVMEAFWDLYKNAVLCVSASLRENGRLVVKRKLIS